MLVLLSPCVRPGGEQRTAAVYSCSCAMGGRTGGEPFQSTGCRIGSWMPLRWLINLSGQLPLLVLCAILPGVCLRSGPPARKSQETELSLPHAIYRCTARWATCHVKNMIFLFSSHLLSLSPQNELLLPFLSLQ
ncbi:hypothetical protein XENOCAPTIV_015733 [Xenoophorus captivus]|uniref:Uncharacterized protein n=1 Tax=Xenoophorus captivus TaxID=1517983 RepID=A0ABV0R8Y9_9TELE